MEWEVEEFVDLGVLEGGDEGVEGRGERGGVHHADAEEEVAGEVGEGVEDAGEGVAGVVAVGGGVLGGKLDLAAAGGEGVLDVSRDVGWWVAVEGAAGVVGDAVGAGVVAAFGDGEGGADAGVVFGESGAWCGWGGGGSVGDEVREAGESGGREQSGGGGDGGDEVGLDDGHAAGDDEGFAGVVEEADAGEHALLGAVDDGAGDENQEVGLGDGGDDGVVGVVEEAEGGAFVAFVGGAAVGLEVDVHEDAGVGRRLGLFKGFFDAVLDEGFFEGGEEVAGAGSLGLAEEDEVEGLEGGVGGEGEVFAGVVDGVVDAVGVPGEVFEFCVEGGKEVLLFWGEGDGGEGGLEFEFDVGWGEVLEPVAGVVSALAEVGVVFFGDGGGIWWVRWRMALTSFQVGLIWTRVTRWRMGRWSGMVVGIW